MVLRHDVAEFVVMRMLVINEENHTLFPTEQNNNKHNDLNYYANSRTSKHIYAHFSPRIGNGVTSF